MDAVERLEAVEAIKALKARYFRCLDTKDWVGLADVFAPGAVMDMGEAEAGAEGDAAVTTGAEPIVGFIRQVVGRMDTVHHGHMPEIEVTGDSTARAIWAMDDLLTWTGRDGTPRRLHGFGHYHETYVKLESGWHIASMRLTRLRVERS